MNTLYLSVSATLLLPLSAGSLLAQSSEPKSKQPNVVLIISDDTRMLDFGCYGSADAVTPNIDRLASEGVRFTNFFQATAMSSPTRHCLLTGLYPVRSGAYPNHTFINEGIETLPKYMKDRGYRVAIQGKRHIQPWSAFPFEELSSEQEDVNIDLIEPFVKDVAQSNTPFFLYVASHDAHSPWTRGDRSLFDPAKLTIPSTLVDTPLLRDSYVKYLAEMNQLDSDVGRIDDLLKRYGLDDNTVFIFTSEQGHQFPFAKWTCYDAGLQTAFIVRWKGVVVPGTTTDAMCEYVDVTPTITDIASGSVPQGLDGRSFLDVIKGAEKEHKEYVFGIQTSRGINAGPQYYGSRSVRDKKYSYIMNLTPEARFKCAVTGGGVFDGWKKMAAEGNQFASERVNAFLTRPAEELYDITKDPFQMKNLAKDPAYSAQIKRMRAKLSEWMESQADKGQQTEMNANKRLFININNPNVD